MAMAYKALGLKFKVQGQVYGGYDLEILGFRGLGSGLRSIEFRL